jgi:hypothetical protein
MSRPNETDIGAVPGRLLHERTITVAVAPSVAFAPIRRIGGDNGYYAYQFLWKLRGYIDRWIGGVGMRRGRRDADTLKEGDIVDFWRVERFDPDRLLRLRAEMKVPGRAWLEFAVEPTLTGTTIRQTARYDPGGFLGMLYWYSLHPVHGLVFGGMLRGIASRATRPDNH